MPYRYVLCCVHADYRFSVLSGADDEPGAVDATYLILSSMIFLVRGMYDTRLK